MQSVFHRNRTSQLVSIVFLLLFVTGCGTSQFSPASRDLLNPLQTALSAKNTEWLDATEKKIAAQHDAKTVSDAEFAVFEKIIKQARAGQWKEALHATVAMIDAQRPSSADAALGSAKKRDREKTEKPLAKQKK